MRAGGGFTSFVEEMESSLFRLDGVEAMGADISRLLFFQD